MRTVNTFSMADVRVLVKWEFEIMGVTLRAWCEAKGVNSGHLSEFLNAARETPGNDVIEALGLEWCVRRKRDERREGSDDQKG